MDEILAFIIDTVNSNVTLPQTVESGQLETDNSIAMQLVAPGDEAEFLERTNIIAASTLILSKNINQQTALANVDNIVNYLTNIRGIYPQPTSNNFQWMTSVVTTRPTFVEKQDNQYYIYSAIINNKIFQ